MADGGKNKAIGEAAQSYFGFSLQLNRMLLTLLESSAGDVVWLEKFDDVGSSRPDGTVQIEQDATYLGSNPLSDSAEKIWKTLSNWVEGANQKWFTAANAGFKLFVLQKHKLGNLATQINAAKSIDDANACLSAITEKHWGKPPGHLKKLSISNNIGSHIENILSNPETAKEIIIRCQIECGSGDPTEDLIKSLSSNPLAPMGPLRRKHLIEYMLGWLKVETDKQFAAGLIAHIPFEDFQKAVSRYASSHLRENLLAPLAPPPDEQEALNLLTTAPTFVRQLSIIECETNDILEAINTFLTAREDFNLWCRDGDVTEQEMAEYANNLIRYWRNSRRGISSSLSDVDFGRQLSSDCFKQNMPFNRRDVPVYFTEGVFHDLANAAIDDLTVGWHKNFKQLLK